MDIHPPDKPIESVKDYLVHLSMITVGILIALGLEQAVESWRHREIAEQARENIVSEIRDNQKELDGSRENVKANQEKLEHGLAVVRALLAHQKLKDLEIAVGANAASLSSASWTTASATGALAYMGYGDVKRFASAYSGQDYLERLQQQEIQSVTTALGDLSRVMEKPEKATDDQLRMVERDLYTCQAQLTGWIQIADQLSKIYNRVLSGK